MKSVRAHVTLTPRQNAVLDKLAKKLLLDRSEVMRLAIARLAEAENIKP
jgi:predicted transcriptional regulator